MPWQQKGLRGPWNTLTPTEHKICRKHTEEEHLIERGVPFGALQRKERPPLSPGNETELLRVTEGPRFLPSASSELLNDTVSSKALWPFPVPPGNEINLQKTKLMQFLLIKHSINYVSQEEWKGSNNTDTQTLNHHEGQDVPKQVQNHPRRKRATGRGWSEPEAAVQEGWGRGGPEHREASELSLDNLSWCQGQADT